VLPTLPRGVTVGPEGISIGRRFVRWEQITRIRKSWVPFLPVALDVRGPQKPMWRRIVGVLSPILRLPPYRIVFREILPVLLHRRPDLPVPDALRKAMRAAENDRPIPRWVAASLLCAGCAVGMMALVRRDAGPMCLLAVAAASVLPILIASVMLNLQDMPERPLAQHTLWSACWASWSTVPSLFLIVPLYTFDVLAGIAGALCLAVGVVLAFRLKLDWRRKAAIVAIVIAAGPIAYGLSTRGTVPGENISQVIGPQAFGPFLWSADARLITGAFSENTQRLADLSQGSSRALPPHAGSHTTRWLDGSFVVRTVSRGKDGGLYVYRLADNREVRLSAAEHIRAVTGRCMRPGGRILCWMEPVGEGGKPRLRACDAATEDVQTLSIAWPGGEKIEWESCGWADAETVVLWGLGPTAKGRKSPPCGLHVLRVSYPSLLVEHHATEGLFEEWRVSPDGRHAFAGGDGERKPAGAWWVDLSTGRWTRLGDGDLPAWRGDGRSAFRAAGGWLRRFDVAAGAETALVEIPADVELVALSPCARFALLQTKKMCAAPLILLNVATGRRRRVGITTLLAVLPGGRRGVFPRASFWSPDSRRFITQGVTFESAKGVAPVKTYLHSVPRDWLGQ